MRRHGKLVREIAAKNRVPGRDIDDVVQVVMLVLWRVLRRGEEVMKPGEWLTTVTMRVAWVQTYKNRRWEQAARRAADPSQIDPEPTAEELSMAVQNVELVHAVANALRPKQREVFVRYELNGEPMAAIALSLGIPLGTAYNRLRTARLAFKKEVRRRERQEGWRRFERKSVLLLPFAFLQWDEAADEGWPAELPGAPIAAPRARGLGGGSGAPWLPCAMVVLGALLLFDSSLRSVHEPEGAMAGAGAETARGEAGTEAVPAAQGKQARETASAPGATSRAEAEGLVAVRAAAPAARSAAPAVTQPSALPSVLPSLLAVKRPRNLEVPRLLLDTADRMAAEGQQNAVDGALRAYAAHAPDDPFPATRAALGPIGGRTPGAE